MPHPDGDMLQMAEPTDQKEGLGPLSFEEQVGHLWPMRGEQNRSGPERPSLFLCFCSCWVLHREGGPSGMRGECKGPSSRNGGRGTSPSWGAASSGL